MTPKYLRISSFHCFPFSSSYPLFYFLFSVTCFPPYPILTHNVLMTMSQKIFFCINHPHFFCIYIPVICSIFLSCFVMFLILYSYHLYDSHVISCPLFLRHKVISYSLFYRHVISFNISQFVLSSCCFIYISSCHSYQLHIILFIRISFHVVYHILMSSDAYLFHVVLWQVDIFFFLVLISYISPVCDSTYFDYHFITCILSSYHLYIRYHVTHINRNAWEVTIKHVLIHIIIISIKITGAINIITDVVINIIMSTTTTTAIVILTFSFIVAILNIIMIIIIDITTQVAITIMLCLFIYWV